MVFFFCSVVKLEARPEDVKSSSLGDLFPACPLGNPSQLEPVTHLTSEPIQPHPWFLRKSHPRGFVLGEAFVPPCPVACEQVNTTRAAGLGQPEV